MKGLFFSSDGKTVDFAMLSHFEESDSAVSNPAEMSFGLWSTPRSVRFNTVPSIPRNLPSILFIDDVVSPYLLSLDLQRRPQRGVIFVIFSHEYIADSVTHHIALDGCQ
jgi:hypothetical protein